MFDTHLADFTHYLRFEKRYAPNTLTAYTRDLTDFKDYLEDTYSLTEVTAVTHFHIRSWLTSNESKRLSARTVNRKLSTLNSFYKFLQRTAKAEKNPLNKLHAQKLPERLPTFVKEQETDYLLNEVTFSEGFAGQTERLICELLYSTGMRRGELVGLQHADVEWSMQQIRVLGKGNKERLIPVNEHLLDSIKSYLGIKMKLGYTTHTTLLVTPSGEPVYAQYIYRIVKRYLGLVTTTAKKSTHVLRHTFATHLLNNGANIQAIKELLGHSSLAATQVYTHNSIDRLKEIHTKAHPRGRDIINNKIHQS